MSSVAELLHVRPNPEVIVYSSPLMNPGQSIFVLGKIWGFGSGTAGVTVMGWGVLDLFTVVSRLSLVSLGDG